MLATHGPYRRMVRSIASIDEDGNAPFTMSDESTAAEWAKSRCDARVTV
jgi:hypothetical protein